MRLIGAMLAAGLGLALGAEAAAEVTLGASRIPPPLSGPVVPPPVRPVPPLRLDGKRPPPPEWGFPAHKRPPGERDRRPPRRKPFLFLPHIDDDDDDRIIVVPAPPAPPPEAEPAAAPEPPPPPDPRGPLIKPARGVQAAAGFEVGQPLPPGVPYVALDWLQYDLPEPPPGRIYARVGRDVLVIDPATRMVERRLEPSELAPG